MPPSHPANSLVYKLSLTAQVSAVHEGSLTAEALVDAHLARTAAHDPELGAYIRMDADRARAAARALDQRRAAANANGVLSKSLKQAVSQSAQFSNPAAHASICRRVTCCGSSINVASKRASYQPLSHSSAARAWSLPMRLASASSVPIGTP